MLTVRATAASTAARSVTSHGRKVTSPPSARMASWTARPSASRRARIDTFAPSCAKRRAVASPIPLLPPVIMATLFCSRPGILVSPSRSTAIRLGRAVRFCKSLVQSTRPNYDRTTRTGKWACATKAESASRQRKRSRASRQVPDVTKRCGRIHLSYAIDDLVAAGRWKNTHRERLELGCQFLPGQRIFRIAFRKTDVFFIVRAVGHVHRYKGRPLHRKVFFDAHIFLQDHFSHQAFYQRGAETFAGELIEAGGPVGEGHRRAEGHGKSGVHAVGRRVFSHSGLANERPSGFQNRNFDPLDLLRIDVMRVGEFDKRVNRSL